MRKAARPGELVHSPFALTSRRWLLGHSADSPQAGFFVKLRGQAAQAPTLFSSLTSDCESNEISTVHPPAFVASFDPFGPALLLS